MNEWTDERTDGWMERDKRPRVGQTSFRNVPQCPTDKTGQASTHGTNAPRRIPANVAGFRPPPVQPLPVRPAIAATVRASPATFGRIRRQSIENGLASRPPFRPCPRPSETRRALCKPSATVCNAISGKRPATWQPCNRSGLSAISGKPSAVAIYPATSNAAPPSNAANVRQGFRRTSRRPIRQHRTRQTCRRIRRQSIRQPFDRGATYPATVCQLPPSNAATYPATLNAATVRNRSRRIPANVSRDRAPPVSHSAAVPSH